MTVAKFPPDGELSYVEFTSNVAITATSAATATDIVDAAAVSFSGKQRAKLEVFIPAVGIQAIAFNGYFVCEVYDGATDLFTLGTIVGFQNTAVGQNVQNIFYGVRYLTPTAGSHTYKAKGWKISTETVTATAGVDGAGVFTAGFIRVSIA